MSGSETGVMTSREPYSLGVMQHKSPIVSQAQPMMQNMRLTFSADGTAMYKPITASSPPTYQPTATEGSAGGFPVTQAQAVNIMSVGNERSKRKRGRPRKYGPDRTIPLSLTPSPSSLGVNQSDPSPPPPPHPPSGGSASAPSPGSAKKARGRPPGSGKKHQLEALGSAAGLGFTPHVITVKAGEDVSSKIMAFSQHGPRAVCILSANGAISNVTLRQPSMSGGTVTYQGRFEILSLSGSFLLSDSGGQRSRTGGLSVSLSGPDGRVLGGGVAGLLTAASPVQVVVGSFIADGRKEAKSAFLIEPLSAPSKIAPGPGGLPTGATSPSSRGTLSESSGGPGSPFNQSTGACNSNNPQGMSNLLWK